MAALGAATIARTPEAMVHPVAWTLPRSAELACTARCALRWGRTRAWALPRGHFDHAAPTGLEAIALGLRSVVDEHITTDERLVPCQDEPVDPRLVRVRVGVWVRLNTCGTAGDGVCQDGGWKAVGSICEFGTDCIDCGSRLLLDAPPTSSVGAQRIPAASCPGSRLAASASRCAVSWRRWLHTVCQAPQAPHAAAAVELAHHGAAAN